jgi:apolipoprotein D and lipocalin family protein
MYFHHDRGFLAIFRFLFVSMCALLFCPGCGSVQKPPSVVGSIDLQRYSGTWYEIARYPNRFEKGCEGVTATYRMVEDGSLEVVNRCRRPESEGSIGEIKGRAKIHDEQSPAKFKVTFFWPFYGHYWIIDLADDYSWAVIGHPRRKYLWILARQAHLEKDVLQKILLRIVDQGYDPERLIYPNQP